MFHIPQLKTDVCKDPLDGAAFDGPLLVPPPIEGSAGEFLC